MLDVRRPLIEFSKALAVCVLLMSPALAETAHEHHKSHHHLPARQVGRAVYYGPGFEGRIMANGHPFDVNALTAASRTLPLGTRVRVTNQRTRKSVILTITDRGRMRGRGIVIDLSPRSARAIGLTEREGVAPVVVQPIR